MKKAMRKLMSLVLAALLIASVTAPTVYAHSGTGTQGSSAFNWTVTKGDTLGIATINTPAVPANVKAEMCNQVYYDLTDEYFETWEVSSTGYVTASASDNNIINVRGVPVRGEIECTIASFWVNNSSVAKMVKEGLYREDMDKEKKDE